MKATARRFGALIPAIALAAGLQFAASPTAHSAPIGDLRLAPTATAVQNSWIVVLKDGTTHAADLGVTPSHTYRNALQGFSTSMSDAKAAELSADPRVAYVEQNATVRINETQTNATGASTVSTSANLPLSKTYTYNTTASNVNAYIIDTGIRTSHSEFGGRASVGTTPSAAARTARTATATARMSPARSAARRTASPRASSSWPYASWTATAPARRRRHRGHRLGDRERARSRLWRT